MEESKVILDGEGGVAGGEHGEAHETTGRYATNQNNLEKNLSQKLDETLTSFQAGVKDDLKDMDRKFDDIEILQCG